MTFIQQIAPYIQKYAPIRGIKVCSPIIAQAVLESASGTSELARNANNYFGLKYRAGRCPTSCGIYHKTGSEQNPDGSYVSSPMQWMKFPDMESGVQGYFDFINVPAYANLRGVTDPRTYLENIRKDGYATSLNYVQNLMNVISRYGLTEYDAGKEAPIPINNLNIQKLAANPANHGGSRNAASIRYLIYHYTANRTDMAVSNARYFRDNIVKASAHYFVDGQEIFQSVDDLVTAYSVGGAKWSDCRSTGGGSLYGRITNANSISIEMCSTNGIISEATLQNAVRLGKELMKKYHIPISNVYRHFDVNGKHCPGWNGWYGQDCPEWTSLRRRLAAAAGTTAADGQAGSTGSTAQGGQTSSAGLPGTGGQAGSTGSTGTGGQTGSTGSTGTGGQAVSAARPNPAGTSDPATYQVRLLDNLNIRKTPNGTITQLDGAKKGLIYTIVETQGNWGRLKSGAGWINVSDKYVERIQGSQS